MAKEHQILDVEELRRGIEHEMEHTTDPVMAAKIAAEHLQEIPDYYTLLEEMEKKAAKGYIVSNVSLERPRRATTRRKGRTSK